MKVQNKVYRILFTGVGRRVELMQAFRQAANQLNIKMRIYGADVTRTAPALAFCDYTCMVCGMRDVDYIPQLLKICEKECIDMLIPTIDTDLLILSQNTELFEKIGTRVLISKPDKITICRDKNYTADFFVSCGLKTPFTVNNYIKYSGAYPCFIKPKDGSSSINAFKIENEIELGTYAKKIRNYIVQTFIEGSEYTIDIFCDYDGNPIYITPRIRLVVRSGEVLKTRIDMDSRIIHECMSIIDKFKPCGPMTVQMIRENISGDDYFIEINPRYGGGAPLSMKAGARSAETVLQLLSGDKVKYSKSISDGAIFSRFDQSVCIQQGAKSCSTKGVIFDLDDTLYSEKEYIRSGYRAVAKYLGNDSYADMLWGFFEEGKPAIDELLSEINKKEEKENTLNIYRHHIPTIQLYSGIKERLKELRADGYKIGIITDGRPEGQRNKIAALGLETLVDDIIITDELGGIQFRKPCDIAFRIMITRWKLNPEEVMYIGDNAEKDFQACKQLGMKWKWIKNNDGLY